MSAFTILGLLVFWCWCFNIGYGLGYVARLLDHLWHMHRFERRIAREISAFINAMAVKS